MSIQIGYVASPAQLPLIKAAGIPCVEATVSAICSWSDEELAANVAAYKEAGIRFESCNCLIGGFSLFDDPDFSKTNEYFDRVLPRLAAAGMKTLVFGSGGYRRVPEGVSREDAKARILDFLRLLSKRIEPYGFTVVIEPLNAGECNILNTSAEAAEYVRELNLPNIRLLVDYYHFLLEGERLSAIYNYKGILAHTHIANPVKRYAPIPYDGIDYAGWFKALEDIGYDGLVVAEPRARADVGMDMLGFAAAMKPFLK